MRFLNLSKLTVLFFALILLSTVYARENQKNDATFKYSWGKVGIQTGIGENAKCSDLVSGKEINKALKPRTNCWIQQLTDPCIDCGWRNFL